MNILTTIITCLISTIYSGKCVYGKRVLNDYIRHYETLNYDMQDLHSRHRRAADSDGNLRFTIKAHGRIFRLNLAVDDSILHPDHYLEWNGGRHKIDTSNIYTGNLQGEPGSRVHGSIINGTFRGEIRRKNGQTFHIENADNYFKGPKSFHTVIYNLKDMNIDPYKHIRESEGQSGACGLNHAVHRSMRDEASSFVQTDQHSSRKKSFTAKSYAQMYENKYSANANSRHKRQIACEVPKLNTCTLYIRSDPILMEWYTKSTDAGGQFGYSEDRAKDEIMGIFSSHVKQANTIYGETTFKDFDGKSKCFKGIQFRVLRTKIMTRQSERCGSSPSEFCNPNLDVSNFLNLNSLADHSAFCLAYVFTRRDWAKGTLGLAWVAGTSGARGGICEKHDKYKDRNHGDQSKSLNTGVITFVNYQKSVPPRVSYLTFAHETGHNFGLPHDTGRECAPYGTSQANADDGNYIMFASATKGDNLNNNAFSVCSMDNITLVLNHVLGGDKNCFKESTGSFCGNGIVEGGEECDCGFNEEECRARNDTCCQPKGAAEECTLKSGAKCSPSQGPCCQISGQSCQFVPASAKMECKVKQDCSNASYCSGSNATCPAGDKQPDYTTLCDDNTQTCYKGECEASVCKYIGWKQCFVEASDKDPNYRDKLCFIACEKLTGQNKTCISSNDKPVVKKETALANLIKIIDKDNKIRGVKLPPGSPCDKFRGYCDIFSKCRGVDAQGPLARLKNLLFSKETLHIILEWVQTHWWAVLLIVIGVIIFMGLFIAVCAVHTPSSNPRKPPARKFGLNTLRRRQHNRDQNRAGGGNPDGNRSANNATAPPLPERNSHSDAPRPHASDPPPPYYYPSRPPGFTPAPGARSQKPRDHGYEMEYRYK